MLVSLHVTHLSAGLEALQGTYARLHDLAKTQALNLEGVEEHVILATCNRFEIYTATKNPHDAIRGLEALVRSAVPYSKDGCSHVILEGRNTVDHLFRVTCGLDSMMIGEDQIQHQVKMAYLQARSKGNIGPRLTSLFERALAVGKRVRTDTMLNNGAVSVGSAAVSLAESRLGGLRDKTVTVLGAGEMATSIARSLKGKGPRSVFVSNRTYEGAKTLAHELEGVAVSLDSFNDVLEVSDVLLVATSAPHILVDRGRVEAALTAKPHPLLIIDISMPSNVDADVVEVPGVSLATMEGLKEIALENIARRRKEIADAEAIVCSELESYEAERREAEALKVIGELNQRLTSIREKEVIRASGRLRTGGDVDAVIEDLSRAIVSKIMAAPYSRLKEASRNGRHDLCRTAHYLFLEDEQ